MVIRLKVLRKQEERIRKIKDMMDTFKVPTYPNYEYQPTGASSSVIEANANPTIAKTRELWQMFGLNR